MEIDDFRRSYDRDQLDETQLNANPFHQFRQWFELATSTSSAAWFEPNAMTLATADKTGRVTARIVLLKKFSADGFSFFTNYDSEKAKQLAANPQASLVFYWPHIERQVRVEGHVAKTDAATSDHYFHSRPRGSQISAAVSPQSRPVTSRQELESQTRELARQFEDQDIPRPDFWGGFTLGPIRMEFWQGRPDRLHDRFSYVLSDDQSEWSVRRLAP